MKKLRNPATPEMISELEVYLGEIRITKPMRKGTAQKLLRMADLQEPDDPTGKWNWRLASNRFRKQLLGYTDMPPHLIKQAALFGTPAELKRCLNKERGTP